MFSTLRFRKTTYFKAVAFVLVWAMSISAANVIMYPEGMYSYAAEAPVKAQMMDDSSFDANNYFWYTESASNINTAARDRYDGYPAGYTLGEEATPYIICTGLELEALAHIVNGTATGTYAPLDASGSAITDNFLGKHIVISGSGISGDGTAFIDLMGAGGLIWATGVAATPWLIQPCNAAGNNEGWVPIGYDEEHAFAGSLRGANGAVDVCNLSFGYRNVTPLGGDSAALGLFGYLSGHASVDGIRLTDTALYTIKGGYMGALAGVADPCAEVTNCSARGVSAGIRTYTDTNGNENTYTVPQYSMYFGAANGSVGGLIGMIKNISDYDGTGANGLMLMNEEGLENGEISSEGGLRGEELVIQNNGGLNGGTENPVSGNPVIEIPVTEGTGGSGESQSTGDENTVTENPVTESPAATDPGTENNGGESYAPDNTGAEGAGVENEETQGTSSDNTGSEGGNAQSGSDNIESTEYSGGAGMLIDVNKILRRGEAPVISRAISRPLYTGETPEQPETGIEGENASGTEGEGTSGIEGEGTSGTEGEGTSGTQGESTSGTDGEQSGDSGTSDGGSLMEPAEPTETTEPAEPTEITEGEGVSGTEPQQGGDSPEGGAQGEALNTNVGVPSNGLLMQENSALPEGDLLLEGEGDMLLAALGATAVPHECTAAVFADLTVENMSIEITEATTAVGGVVGKAEAESSISFTGSFFSGKIKSVSTQGTGGIIGMALGTGTIEIYDGIVRGLTEGEEASEALIIELSGFRGGGLVGYSEADSLTIASSTATPVAIAVEFRNSLNPASTATFHQIGGLLGAAAYTTHIDNYNVTMSAIGRIWSASSLTDTLGGVGGLIGYISGGGNYNIDVENSVASLNLYINSSKSNNNVYIGGIVGRVQNEFGGSMAITSCSAVDSSIRQLTHYTTGTGGRVIAIGGIAGGINNADSTVNVTNCTVSGWEIAADGFVGGIAGLGNSGGTSCLDRVENCTVTGFHVKQYNMPNASNTDFPYSGGIAPAISGAVITGCTVTDVSFEYIVGRGRPYGYVGGIAGFMYPGSSVENTMVDIDVRVGSTVADKAFYVGGIAGVSEGNTSVSLCGAVLDFETTATITAYDTYSPNSELSYDSATFTAAPRIITVNGGNAALSPAPYYVGGFIGSTSDARGTASITNSFTSGRIDIMSSGANRSAAGGFVGIVNAIEKVNISGSFSTMSLSAGKEDGTGGLVGVNVNSDTNVLGSWFGGTLLNPWAGAIAGFVRGGNFTASVNTVRAPNGNFAWADKANMPAGDVTPQKEIPGELANAIGSGNISPVVASYFAIASENWVDFREPASGTAPSHVFSVYDRTSAGTIVYGANTTPGGAGLLAAAMTPVMAVANEGVTDISNNMVSMLEIMPLSVTADSGSLLSQNSEEGTNSEEIPSEVQSTETVTTQSLEPVNKPMLPAAEPLMMTRAGGANMGSSEFSVTTAKDGVSIVRDIKLIDRIPGHDSENGTEFPYTIGSLEDLGYVGEYTALGGGFKDCRFIITADIQGEITPVGSEAMPFCGNLNGSGSAITNTAASGLFNYVYLANIENLKLIRDGNITGYTAGGNNAAGLLAAHGKNSEIRNIDACAAGTGITSNASYFGGLIGSALSCTLENLSFTGAVSSARSGDNMALGGILGYGSVESFTFRTHSNVTTERSDINLSGRVTMISKSYTTGDVGLQAHSQPEAASGSQNVGGIAGRLDGAGTAIDQCFTFGNVSGYKNVGGLAGKLGTGIINISNAYMRGDIYAGDYAGGLIGYSENQASGLSYGYFAGQISGQGVAGAAAASKLVLNGFYFDAQLGGNLPLIGTETEASNAGSAVSTAALTAELFPKRIIVEDKKTFYAEELVAAGACTANSTSFSYEGATLAVSLPYSNVQANGRFGYVEADKRFSAYNTQSNAKITATFTFNGTYFNFKDYISGGSAPFTVTVDGERIGNMKAGGTLLPGTYTGVETKKYEKFLNIDGARCVVTGMVSDTVATNRGYTQALVDENTCYINGSSDAINPAGGYTTFSVAGLNPGTHTITIESPAKSGSSWYLTFVGFEYGDDSEEGLNFNLDGAGYPELTAFPGKAASALSVEKPYDFGGDIKNNAYSIQENMSVTAGAADTTITLGDVQSIDGTADITDIVSYTDLGGGYHRYTNDVSSAGIFELISQRTIDGYPLNIISKMMVIPFEGDGTEAAPFEIPDVPTLEKFRDYINNVYNGRGHYYKLTMEGDYDYDLSTAASGNDTDWTPVGTAESPFSGHFVGNNKLISNLSITTETAAVRNGTDELIAGLFGYVNGAVLTDFTVSGGINTTFSKGKPVYAGMAAAVARNSVFDNVSVKSTGINYTLTPLTGSSDPQSIKTLGGMIGLASGVTVSDSFVRIDEFNVTMTGSRRDEATSFIGGLVGQLYGEEGRASLIENALVYANIKENGGTRLPSHVGGIAGNMGGRGTAANSASAVIDKSAAYGTLEAERSKIGGIAGSYTGGNSSGTYSLTVQNCISTADIKAPGNSFNRIGGIVGDGEDGGKNVINCMYGGVISSDSTQNQDYVTGVASIGSNAVAFTNVAFDSTKNYDINAKRGTSDGSAALDTYRLTGDHGTYYDYNKYLSWNTDVPAFISSGAVTGGAAHAAIIAEEAEQLLKGQNIALYIVRTSKVRDGGGYSPIPDVSSVYVRGDGAQLLLDSGESTAAQLTAEGKRAVSTAGDETNSVTVKAQLIVTDEATGTTSDAFGGYGKSFTYYPSVKSTGRTDASYLIANPLGDGIGSASDSYTIYTADQLMGLDVILESSNLVSTGASEGDRQKADETGGLIDSEVYVTSGGAADAGWLSLSGRTVYMGRDISFEDSNYINTGAYNNTVVGALNQTEAVPFEGIFDGRGYLITDRVLRSSQSDSVGGLFAEVYGGTIRNTGLVNSLISVSSQGNTGTDIGSLVGTLREGTLSGVFSTARVEHDFAKPDGMNIGGLVGLITGGSGENRNLIEKSYFTGTIGRTAVFKNNNYVYEPYDGTVMNYWSGGIAGSNHDGFTLIRDSYAAGYVYGYDNSEGAGSSRVYKLAGGGELSFENCWFDDNAGAEIFGDSPAVLAAIGNLIPGTAIDGFTQIAGMYPVLTAFTDNGAPKNDHVAVSAIPVTFGLNAASMVEADIDPALGAAFATDNYAGPSYMTAGLYSITSGGLHLDRVNNGIGTVHLKYGTAGRTVSMNMQCWYDNFTEENGQKVYTIKDAGELVELANLIEHGDEALHIGHSHNNHGVSGELDATFEGAVIKLGDDIVYESGDFVVPIGMNETNPFIGTFDGNGYTIVNPAYEYDPALGVLGIFGYIGEGGTVKNVGVVGEGEIELTGDAPVHAGVIAGVNGGSIINCYNGLELTINAQPETTNVHFGGVAGKNLAGKTVSGCYNMAHITALSDGMAIGGIVGENLGTVENSYNTGIITGYTDILSVDYINKTVMAGIAAMSSGTVNFCYNGAVLENFKAPSGGESFSNPIANGTGTIQDCAMDRQNYVKNFGAATLNNGNIAEKSTSQLIAGDAMTTWNSGIWSFAEEGYYPMLKVFSQSPSAGVKAASYVSALALRTEGTAGSAFDNFSLITGVNGSYQTPEMTEAAQIKIDANTSNSSITFQKSIGESMTTFMPEEPKNGLAYIEIKAELDGFAPFRECMFLGESKYEIKYKYDFSQILSNGSGLASPRTPLTGDSFILEGNAISEASAGSGTSIDPYLIATAQDLLNLASYVNSGGSTAGGYFKLMNNISFDGMTYVPIGTLASAFNGNFNGNGYKLSGINYTSDRAHGGVFGYIGSAGAVELLAVEDSTFAAAKSDANRWIGSIAGYNGGSIYSCYSTALVTISGSGSGDIFAGGLAGEIGQGGELSGCYAKPAANMNYVFESSVGSAQTGNFGGIIAGKVSGRIDGCYHLSFHNQVAGYGDYGVIAGWKTAEGEIVNTYYNSDPNFVPGTARPLFWTDSTKTNVVTPAVNASYGWSDAQFKKTETQYEDSAAMLLSEGIYLGTYEMAELRTGMNTNGGYPQLAGFEIAGYDIAGFEESTNLVLNIQNIDAQVSRMLNAIGSIETFDFPVYAEMLAKTTIYANVTNFPETVNFNLSAVAYGTVADSASYRTQKAAIIDGQYAVTEGAGANSDAVGAGLNTGTGARRVSLVSVEGGITLPSGINKICVYVTFIPGSEETWGVRDSWNSNQLQTFGENVEEDEL